MTDHLSDLSKAILFFAQRTEKLYADLGSLSDSYGEKGNSLVDENLPDEVREQLETEHKELQTVSKLVGNDTSANLLADMKRIEIRLYELDSAYQLGLVTDSEHLKTSEELNHAYDDLNATLKASSLTGVSAAKKLSSLPKKAGDLISGQLGGVLTGTVGLISNLTSHLPAAGLFGLLLYGILEKDRLNQQAGEVVNLLSATGSELTNASINHLASFQEKASKFYSISKESVQGVVKELVDAGMSVEQITRVQWKNLGEVGENVVTASLAVDAFFEHSQGFTNSAAVELIDQHGIALNNAVNQIVKIEFAGKNAGAGVEEFTKEALEASAELKNYGVEAESVASLLIAVQQSYEKTGSSAQSAMKWALDGMSEIAGGFKNLSVGINSKLAQSMGYGSGIEGTYALRDRIAVDDPNQLKELVDHLFDIVKSTVSDTANPMLSDSTKMRLYLEGLGFGQQGSKALVEVAGKLDKPLAEVSKEEWSGIRQAFTQEGTKTSAIMKDTEQILIGMRNTGQGLLGMFTNFAAYAIMSMKALLQLDWADVAGIFNLPGSSLLPHNDELKKSVSTALDQQWHRVTDSMDQVKHGFSMSWEGIKDIAQPVLEPVAVARDLKVNPVSRVGGDGGPKRMVTMTTTKLSMKQAVNVLATAWQNVFGEQNDEAVALLASQWSVETGTGSKMYNYNFAGIKGYSYLGTAFSSKTKEGYDKTEKVITDKFRAYETVEQGAEDYVRFLASKYKDAVNAAAEHNANEFVHQLKAHHYFTGSEKVYTKLVNYYSSIALKTIKEVRTSISSAVVTNNVNGRSVKLVVNVQEAGL